MNFYRKKNIYQFFETKPIRCSYLKEKYEKRLVISLKPNDDNDIFHKLTSLGFRRNLDYMYLPICNHCSECISSRISVKNYKFSKSQKRNLKKNSRFRLEEMITSAEDVRYEVFQSYVNNRHKDSQMNKMTKLEFSNFICNTPVNTKVFDLGASSNNIIGSILLDQLFDGMSAVYSFYKPEYLKNGIGIYLILKAIEKVQMEKKKFLYLGYWVKNSKKMDYKIKFNNLQVLVDGNWRFFNQEN